MNWGRLLRLRFPAHRNMARLQTSSTESCRRLDFKRFEMIVHWAHDCSDYIRAICDGCFWITLNNEVLMFLFLFWRTLRTNSDNRKNWGTLVPYGLTRIIFLSFHSTDGTTPALNVGFLCHPKSATRSLLGEIRAASPKFSSIPAWNQIFHLKN